MPPLIMASGVLGAAGCTVGSGGLGGFGAAVGCGGVVGFGAAVGSGGVVGWAACAAVGCSACWPAGAPPQATRIGIIRARGRINAALRCQELRANRMETSFRNQRNLPRIEKQTFL